ncbi:MAG: glycosyltransferase family 2 protein [Candidatus Kerfeldbacteria bacterium]|nr:glycosyltransferase family 2 protein [Candidatus Kerfeldbacteria bacterium]
MKPYIIIPAYNESKTIREVLDKIKQKYDADHVIVIDDGSTDSTYADVQQCGVRVYRHAINRGLGGALGTGLAVARALGAELAVTLDADGQHDIDEIDHLIAPIINKEAQVVIGSRLLQPRGMPMIRRAYNRIANIITWIIFGVWTTDSQSGFRAFSQEAIKVVNLRTNRMEVSSEFFKEIKAHRLTFQEVPIRAIYTDYSLSKGQNFFVGIKTVVRLILLRLRGK